MSSRNVGSPLPSSSVQVGGGAGASWKRRRAVASPGQPQAVGGATAPTTVAVSTPPAQRQRVVSFTLSATDLEGKLEELKAQVTAEFAKVHADVVKLQDDSLDFVNETAYELVTAAQNTKWAKAQQCLRRDGPA